MAKKRISGSERMKRGRTEKGFTQSQFVALYNATAPLEITIDQATISLFETGAFTNMPLPKFEKAMDILEG